MSDLTCPKCHASMRTYERNGIHVEQCTECRGIFLDRGELEHLIAAEAAWSGAAAAPAAAPAAPPAAPAAPPAPPVGYGDPRGAYPDPRDYRDDHYYSSGKKPSYKRKKSFLEELFD